MGCLEWEYEGKKIEDYVKVKRSLSSLLAFRLIGRGTIACDGGGLPRSLFTSLVRGIIQ